jgi:ABC-2 type transport system ATP-binding protein
LSVEEVLARSASCYPNPRDVAEVIHLVGLEEKATSRVKSLSGGQQRRLDLGLGIIGNRELLFLDELTTGFVPSARRGAGDAVRNLVRHGTTVILTTHHMDEAEALADPLAISAGGRIVAMGTVDSIGGRERSSATIRFRLPQGLTTADLPGDLPHAETERSGPIVLTTDDEVEVVHPSPAAPSTTTSHLRDRPSFASPSRTSTSVLPGRALSSSRQLCRHRPLRSSGEGAGGRPASRPARHPDRRRPDGHW